MGTNKIGDLLHMILVDLIGKGEGFDVPLLSVPLNYDPEAGEFSAYILDENGIHLNRTTLPDGVKPFYLTLPEGFMLASDDYAGNYAGIRNQEYLDEMKITLKSLMT